MTDINYLFYDSETTGLPIWDRRSDHPGQPRIIQLAALLTDAEGNKLSALDTLIKPDGWRVPAEITELTGLTTERCERGGIPMNRALAVLIDMWRIAKLKVAHNQAFDNRMVRIEIKRSDLPWATDALADEWKVAPRFCTQVKARPICNLPMPSGKKGSKPPKLTEAYQFFMGKPLEDAHDAFADVLAVKDVFFAIKAREGAQGDLTQEPEPFIAA